MNDQQPISTMTAPTQQGSDKQPLVLSPTMMGVIVTVIVALIGAAVANERMISSKPSREDVRDMIESSNEVVEAKLETQKVLMQSQSETLRKIEQKLDRLNDQQNE